MFRKTPEVPTFEHRSNAAHAKASAAMSVFHGLVSDLEDAAEEHSNLSLEVQDEIDRLTELLENSLVAEADALHAADKIRSLFA